MSWKTGTARELIRDLRVSGWLSGQSDQLSRMLALHKTELIRDLRREAPDRIFQWTVAGDPEATGRYARNRRRVIIWLGK